MRIRRMLVLAVLITLVMAHTDGLAAATGPQEHVILVPAVAHVRGAGGTTWRSNVVLHNPGSTEATVELLFFKNGEGNSDAVAHPASVPSASSVRLDDIVAEPFGESAPSGAVLVRSDEPLMVASRTFNDSPDGSFGQSIPGIPLRRALRTGDEGRMIQLSRSPSSSAGFRTNIGVAEAAGVRTQVEVRLYTGMGEILGTVPVTLSPYEHVQINDVFGAVTDDPVEDGYAVVRARSRNAAYFAYASVINNRSGDPVYISATVTPDWITQPGVWYPTDLQDVSVQAVATDPFDASRVLVGTRGHGLHHSDDWGKGWSWLWPGQNEPEVFAIAFNALDPDTVYAGTWHHTKGPWRGGIYRSLDGGESWSKKRTAYVRAIAVHPEDASVVLVGTQGSGIYRTEDNGETWTQSNTGLGSHYVKALAFDRSAPEVVFAATEDGIDMSEDGGLTWRHSGLSHSFGPVAVHPRDGNIVYTSRSVMNGGYLYVSRDGGQSWQEVAAVPSGVTCILFDPSPPHTLYVGTEGGGVFSQMAEGRWMPLNEGLTDLRIRALGMSSGHPSFLIAGTAARAPAIGDGAVFVMELP